MAEYIEKEAAVKFARHAYNQWNLAMAAADGKREINLVYKRQELCKAVESVFADSPPADVAPVVHGRWIYDCDATDWGIGGYICSRCKIKNNNLPCNRFKMVSVFSGAKFCPNCGAKMDLED